MPKSTRTNPAVNAAIRQKRNVLRAVKDAVAAWAVKAYGRRERVADGMIQLLGECATDNEGDDTLEVVSQFFEEYTELLHADHGGSVAHAVANLAKSAHALGRAHSARIER